MKLEEYFKINKNNDCRLWNTDLDKYPISGINLVGDIQELSPLKILDIGCGYNEFKEHIPNIIGIDIANDLSDYKMNFIDYECEDNSQDVILALGSINFGNIKEQMEWVSRKTKVGGTIFMRVNHNSPPSSEISDIFSAWSLEDIFTFSKKFGLSIKDNSIQIEERIASQKIRDSGSGGFSNTRLFWRYIKS